jgi:DNA polymerase delta subunit 1
LDVLDFRHVESVPLSDQSTNSSVPKSMSQIAPIRILSFDIECCADKGKFPTPNCDSVIQIGNVVKIHGEDSVFARVVFTLNSCAPIVNTQVNQFETEREMLLAWSEFVR